MGFENRLSEKKKTQNYPISRRAERAKISIQDIMIAPKVNQKVILMSKFSNKDIKRMQENELANCGKSSLSGTNNLHIIVTRTEIELRSIFLK